MRLRLGLILLLGLVPILSMPRTHATSETAITSMDDMVRMNRCQLETLYRSAHFAELPTGFAPGRAIYKPGSRLTVPASKVIRVLWRGKIIREDGTMINRIFGGKAVVAQNSIGDSWLDGGQTFVMDYAETSRRFADVRDEVREVSPGLFLGLTYLRKCPAPELAMFFALDTRCR